MNIIGSVKTAGLVISLIPQVVDLVKSVERIMPESGQGSKKLELVKDKLLAVNSAYEEVWPSLEKVIGVVVSAFNLTGVFSKGG